MKRYESVTRLSGVPALEPLKKFHTIPGFKIGGHYEIGDPRTYEFGGADGITLESLGAEPLRTAYIAVGTPQEDHEGRITNAIVINCSFSGDSAWSYFYWYKGQDGNFFALGPVVGPGCIIDTERYYVVFLDALGLWGASKPSEGLGLDFPPYSIFDCVQANYRLLKDELNLADIKLATGVSMGAIQTYAWAVLHPEYVRAIMPIGGSTSTRNDPVLRWNFDLMAAGMKSDPVWRRTNGEYYHLPKADHPNLGMMFGWSILLLNGLDVDFRIEQGWDEVNQEIFSWERGPNQGSPLMEKARDYDVNDLLVRKRSQGSFDVDKYLAGIRCPTLVIHCKNDLWLRVKLAEQAARRIPSARFVSYENQWGHYSVFRAPNLLKSEVSEFIRDLPCP